VGFSQEAAMSSLLAFCIRRGSKVESLGFVPGVRKSRCHNVHWKTFFVAHGTKDEMVTMSAPRIDRDP
jgi:hypothetical protein